MKVLRGVEGRRTSVMKLPSIIFVPILAILRTSDLCADQQVLAPPSFSKTRQVSVRDGAIWCGLVWDGTHIVASTENRRGILLRKYKMNLDESGAEAIAASPDDTRNRQNIADHKHLFLKDHHYIVFSVAGARDSYLVRIDNDLRRVAIVPVVNSADIPTNDMFLVTDGERIHVGHFLPGRGHRVYTFSSDLKSAGPPVTIGADAHRHANGAAAIYLNERFHVLAPKTLDPRDPNAIYRMTFDKEWKSDGERTTMIESGSGDRMVTGLTRLDNPEIIVIHYMCGKPSGGGQDDSGVIMRQIYSKDWKSLGDPASVVRHAHRPHTAAVGEHLYLGYDSPKGVFIENYTVK